MASVNDFVGGDITQDFPKNGTLFILSEEGAQELSKGKLIPTFVEGGTLRFDNGRAGKQAKIVWMYVNRNWQMSIRRDADLFFGMIEYPSSKERK